MDERLELVPLAFEAICDLNAMFRDDGWFRALLAMAKSSILFHQYEIECSAGRKDGKFSRGGILVTVRCSVSPSPVVSDFLHHSCDCNEDINRQDDSTNVAEEEEDYDDVRIKFAIFSNL